MKKTKSIIFLVFILIISTIAVACGDDRPSINVFNWGDYIDMDVVREFEKEFGIKVNYGDYATNEDLYVKLKQGGDSYDVIFPSDYMIERMVREDLLVKLDKSNIPNIANVDEIFMGLDYDPNNEYSVPYMWGTVGMIYNKTMVNQPLTKWADLWDEQYDKQIIMLNSQRDTLAVALKKLGYSLNTRDVKELEEARDELIRQKPLVYAYMGDEVKDAMISGEAAIAVVWSGDAVAMIRENPDLEYVIPEEGTNLWFDAMVIPKSAKNKEGAEKFINFLTRPEISAKNTDYIGYSTPLPEAVDLLPDDIRNSLVAYPTDEMIEDTEIFKDVMDIIQVYDRIWTDITSEQ